MKNGKGRENLPSVGLTKLKQLSVWNCKSRRFCCSQTLCTFPVAGVFQMSGLFDLYLLGLFIPSHTVLLTRIHCWKQLFILK